MMKAVHAKLKLGLSLQSIIQQDEGSFHQQIGFKMT
jgi:hypothetical protein